MTKIITLLALLALAFANHHHNHHDDFEDPNTPIITSEYIDHLKQHATYEVYDYENHPFKDYSLNLMREKVCLIELEEAKEEDYIEPFDTSIQAPTSFDSRTKWPSCVQPIRNQGNCGSCWAFAAAEVLGHRLCIAGKGNVVLSPQHLVDCDSSQMACSGGYISKSWYYLSTKGVVSDSCYPYTSGTTRRAGTCRSSCPKAGQSFKKYYASSKYGRLRTIEEAKTHISTAGPVETGMYVYSDLYNYRSGIYKPASGARFVGGHAVMIVGYGVSGGVNYWIIANSWGSSWGERGYFRIQMGTSSVESQLYYAMADTTRIEEGTYAPSHSDIFLN